MQIKKFHNSTGPSNWYKKPYFGGLGPWTKSVHLGLVRWPIIIPISYFNWVLMECCEIEYYQY